VIVIGSGAGGATAARDLAARGVEVVVLEAGRPFQPFTRRLGWAEALRGAGLLGGEGLFSRIFPHLRFARSAPDLLLVRGVTTGGCTVFTCGNVLRAESGLDALGLDLSAEYAELEAALCPQPIPREWWRPVTRALFDAAARLGLDPSPTPKAIDPARCVRCGLCELGCATGARWDSRRFLADAAASGAVVRTGLPVRRVIIEEGRACGVMAGGMRSPERIEADAVVLAAGGIGTAQILRASGLPARDRLWGDLVLTLGGRLEGANQLREPPMAWVARREGYILAPYLDILSHYFHPPWRDVPIGSRVGLMIKLAEAADGVVGADGRVRKAVSGADRRRLEDAAALAREVMEAAGVGGPYVPGMLNAGHFGGTAPLAPEDVPAMRPSWLPEGLWIADLSLLPASQGMPTTLTTAALALRVARRVAGAA